VDKNNIIYIGTPDDYAFSFNGKIWQPFNNLPLNKVTCFTFDKNNVLYVGTYRGFTTFDGSNYNIYTFKNSGLPDFFVEAIAVDNLGNRFIGTHRGVTDFDSLGNWIVYNSRTFPDSNITALAVDRNDNLWIGTKTGGVVRKTPSNFFSIFNNEFSKLLSDNVTAMTISPMGEVWVGFDKNTVFGNGLSYFDGAGWINVYPIPPSSRTNAILINKNNVKWVATDEGVIMFTSASSATTFNHDNTGLNINHATGLAEDTFGNIWISTDAGLIEYKGNH
jgi:ligand-binding sensor domain-containing protein